MLSCAVSQVREEDEGVILGSPVKPEAVKEVTFAGT